VIVEVDLFIKKVPQVVKELIAQEAFDNRRSVNQEAIALLEEALVHRVAGAGSKRKRMENLLTEHFDSQKGGAVPAPAATNSGALPSAEPDTEPGALARAMRVSVNQTPTGTPATPATKPSTP
jgi:hypothetical protein